MNKAAIPPIRVVEKALKILQAFHDETPDLSLTEISQRLGFPKSVTYNLLQTMAASGFVKRDATTRRYRLGPGILTAAGVFMNSDPLMREAPPILRRIARETGHTATLGIFGGRDVLFISVAEGSQLIRAGARVGDRRPLHATATGKILLSELTEGQLDELLGRGPFPRFTPNTITTRRKLRKELDAVRARGVAYNLRERAAEGSALAVPVRDFTGRIVAGLAVIFPAGHEQPKALAHLGALLTARARELSAQLGALRDDEHRDARAQR